MTEQRNPTIDEVHRRVGRNVLMFQRIEQAMRSMLPYIHPEGGAKGANSLRGFSDEIAELTLGELVKRFKAAVQGTPEWWEADLPQLVAARNELMHDFFRNDRFNLLSPQGVQDAMAYLDEQHQAAEEWAELFRVQSLVLLVILIDTNPSIAARFGVYRDQLVAQLPASLEVVDQADPRRTVWASTRIVKLLRVAEQHTEPVDGMTLLSRAGQFIKENAPDVVPQEYGVNKLSKILLESQLFDVRGGTDGSPVLYRSKPEFADLPLDLETNGLGFSLVRQR